MNLETAVTQCRRLGSLRGYEKAKDELARIAEKYAQNDTHLFTVVSQILEQESICPSPSILRNYLTAGLAKEDERWKAHRKCPLGLCVGDGWRVHYFLHTRGGSGTTREPITAEQAAMLRSKIDPQRQTIYEGVAPCGCRGEAA